MSKKLAKTKVYYWNSISNFGDRLTPLLIDKLCHIETEWDTVSHAKVVGIGSVLEHIPPLWDGIIIGAGKLYPDSRLHLHTNTATILALRGPLSAAGVPGDYALGDPGLLAPTLLEDHERERMIDLGVLPHWSDTELADDPRFKSDKYSRVVIDPRDDPLEVVRMIARCHNIVTSSLHGMIVADSLGIPVRFETTSQFKKDGGHYKLHDYSKSIVTPFEVGKKRLANSFHIQCRQRELLSAFMDLGDML